MSSEQSKLTFRVSIPHSFNSTDNQEGDIIGCTQDYAMSVGQEGDAAVKKKSTEDFYVNADFDDVDSLFSANPVYLHTYYETKKRAMESLNLCSAQVLLDIGCGQGYLLQIISRRQQHIRCVGIDLNLNDLKKAKMRRHSVKCGFVLADAAFLPFRDEVIDQVTCTAVLEHVVDEDRVLREIRRVLNPGGLAVLDVPGMYHLQNKLSDFFVRKFGIFPFHREYSENSITSKVKNAGFELQSFTSARFVGSLLFPVIETVYTCNRKKIVWCRGTVAKIVCRIGDTLSTSLGNKRFFKLLGGSWFFTIKKL